MRINRNNYRSISLCSIICKVMESLVKRTMMDHLVHHNLLNVNQHGFVRFKSCVPNLLECIDIISLAINRGHRVDVIYLDFAKAFDKVWHRGLLHKLNSYGLNNRGILKWLESFLSNRRQRVVICEYYSEWKSVLKTSPRVCFLGLESL